jgi:hypothetical protein
MGFLHEGKYVSLPWNDKFEQQLVKVSEYTDQFSGEDLLHEIHRETIQAKWINLHLHRLIRTRLAIVILLQLVIVGLLLIQLR